MAHATTKASSFENRIAHFDFILTLTKINRNDSVVSLVKSLKHHLHLALKDIIVGIYDFNDDFDELFRDVSKK